MQIIHIFYRCHSATIFGVEYKAGSVVRMSSSIGSLITYALIQEIIICEEEKLLTVKKLETKSFDRTRWAFTVSLPSDSDIHLVLFQSLHCHGTLPLLSKGGIHYVIEMNYNVKNLWSLL